MFYLSLVLLVFVVIGLSVMGIRTILDPGRFDFFNQIGLPRAVVLAWAVYTVVGALSMAHPRTFVVGCVMLLLNNFFIIGVYVKSGNIGSAALGRRGRSCIGAFCIGRRYFISSSISS